MLTCFWKQWREKGSFKGFDSEAWTLHTASLAIAVCWARYGRLPADFNLIAGNSVFWKWLCCCNILRRSVKSWEGIFYRKGWNVPSKPWTYHKQLYTEALWKFIPKRDTFPPLSLHLGQVHPLCSARQALWVRSAPFAEGTHMQPCLALSSSQAKAELGCLLPLSYLLCCDYISSICLAPTFSFPLLVYWFLGHSFARVTLTSFVREGTIFSD